jgi:hypothetical protein
MGKEQRRRPFRPELTVRTLHGGVGDGGGCRGGEVAGESCRREGPRRRCRRSLAWRHRRRHPTQRGREWEVLFGALSVR